MKAMNDKAETEAFVRAVGRALRREGDAIWLATGP